MGPSLAKTVIKAHMLTGDDCMIKVGSKHAAMACDPINYMTNFGGDRNASRARYIISGSVLSTCLSRVNYNL